MLNFRFLALSGMNLSFRRLPNFALEWIVTVWRWWGGSGQVGGEAPGRTKISEELNSVSGDFTRSPIVAPSRVRCNQRGIQLRIFAHIALQSRRGVCRILRAERGKFEAPLDCCSTCCLARGCTAWL